MQREVTYTKSAAKSLLRMPVNTANLIRGKVLQYAADPASLANNVKALKGSDFKRLRVGDWRVIFSEDMKVVAVIEVGPRGGIYD